MAYDILIVDDEADIRMQIAGILEDEGYEPREAANSEQALQAVSERQPSLAILDVWLKDSALDGIQLLEQLKTDHPGMPIIMISGHGTFDMAVNATKIGAVDFLSKPFKTDVLLHTLEKALKEMRLERENEQLKTASGGDVSEFLGISSFAADIRKLLDRTAGTDSRILISGPPGSGKGALARIVHESSLRRQGPFVSINCASLESETLEEQLFGLEATSTHARKVGLLEKAHGGTLVLDDVVSLSKETQGKLVRILHSPKFNRLGGSTLVAVNVRILATSSADLNQAIEQGQFREDLYHRLNVVPIQLLPLVSRRDDIPVYSGAFMARLASSKGRVPREFGDDALAALQGHSWPGNLWELHNVIERILLLGNVGSEEKITADHVVEAIGESQKSEAGLQAVEMMNLPLREAREVFEREYLVFHLARFSGNISRTAEFVEMDRAALHRKLKSLGIQGVSKRASEQ